MDLYSLSLIMIDEIDKISKFNQISSMIENFFNFELIFNDKYQQNLLNKFAHGLLRRLLIA